MRRFGLILTAVSLMGGTAVARTPKSTCTPVAGAGALLAPEAHVVVGEVHGTVEAPRLVGELACLASRQGPVRVGLEIPEAERDALAGYLASRGTSADRATLLRGSFWTDRYQDGRRSQAVLALLEALRVLKHNGGDVAIEPYDGSDADNGNDRDAAMAKRLAAAFGRAPKATFVVLTGNLHARKTPGRFKRAFMAARLVEAGATVTTLDGRYGAGTAWVCAGGSPESCGPAAFGTGAGASADAVTLARSEDGAYDGTFDVGPATFSPPAAVAMTEAQSARIALAKERSHGHADYETKRFLQCGETYVDLAKRDRMPADDAYMAACCFALGGAADRAFEQLGEASTHGFRNADWLEKDNDLASLRPDPRWKTFISQLRSLPVQKKAPAP